MASKWSLLCGGAIFALSVATAVHAEEAAPAPASDASASRSTESGTAAESGNDIVVTARKVAEAVQDIPVAITAFSAKDLQDRSLKSLQDISLQTPGFVYEDYSNGGYGAPTIRGATQFNITNLEQNVSVFLDGIYIPRQYSFDVGTLTLERVEVVKGPQSALYGANAFAGAINYITTERSLSRFTAHAELGVSEDGGLDISGKINLPIVADRISVRAAGSKSKYGGSIPNSHPNANVGIYPGTNGNFGGHDNYSISVGATVKPIEALTLDFDYYHFDIKDEVNAAYRIESTNHDMICGQGIGLWCGAIPVSPVNPQPGTSGYIQDPRSSGIAAKTDVYRAAANLKITDQLSVTYQFGHIAGSSFAAGDSDKYPLIGTGTLNVFTYGPVGHYKYESHEARLQYESAGGFYAMIGAFAQTGDDLDIFSFGYVPLQGTAPITSSAGALVTQPTPTHTKTRAIFGRIAVPMMDKRLNLSVEARYAHENKATSPYDYSANYFTPRAEIDYHLTSRNMVYASVAKGVKVGGINTSTYAGLIPAERYYGADTNWTYEIGSKNSFADGRGFLNVDAFYIDWSSLQVPQTPTGAPINTATVTVNLGGAKSKGVEISGSYKVVDHFTIDGGFAYIDAKLNNGVISGRLARAGICDNVVCAANGDVSGKTLQRQSPWQWNVGLAYNAPISGTLRLLGRVDVFGQAKQWTDESNTAYIPSRTLANVRVGVEGDHWQVAVWAKNVFDKRYVSNAFFTATPFGTSYVPSIGQGRRIGATASYDF